jgi:hypothetical protein
MLHHNIPYLSMTFLTSARLKGVLECPINVVERHQSRGALA